MKVKLFNRVISISFSKNGKDWKFSIRSTFLEPLCIGICSNVDDKDIYEGQEHVGIFDFDDRLPVNDLREVVRMVQKKFHFVGDGYIYETSPKKYCVHYYNHASYWDWLMVVHYLRELLDPAFVRWRLFRPSMVMRISPKSNGYIPTLVDVIESDNQVIEDVKFRESVLLMLKNEMRLKEVGK